MLLIGSLAKSDVTESTVIQALSRKKITMVLSYKLKAKAFVPMDMKPSGNVLSTLKQRNDIVSTLI